MFLVKSLAWKCWHCKQLNTLSAETTVLYTAVHTTYCAELNCNKWSPWNFRSINKFRNSANSSIINLRFKWISHWLCLQMLVSVEGLIGYWSTCCSSACGEIHVRWLQSFRDFSQLLHKLSERGSPERLYLWVSERKATGKKYREL